MMKVLVIDIGGTNVKILATGQAERRKVPSGPTLTPRRMVADVTKLAADWQYDAVSIGYPGKVVRGKIISEPHNLAKGWVGFDFGSAFGLPVKLMNDAAMQALGSYQAGTMLFLGLGTGLGSALVVEGTLVPMELAHLPAWHGTYEDYLGLRGIERFGKRKWRQYVEVAVVRLQAALNLDEVVIGGGNAKELKELPEGCRIGNNLNAFRGGFRLWEDPKLRSRDADPAPRGSGKTRPATRKKGGSS